MLFPFYYYIIFPQIQTAILADMLLVDFNETDPPYIHYSIMIKPNWLNLMDGNSPEKWNNIFTRGQFWPLGIVVACICACLVCLSACLSVCPSVCLHISVCQLLVCPHDSSSLIQARITQFRGVEGLGLTLIFEVGRGGGVGIDLKGEI